MRKNNIEKKKNYYFPIFIGIGIVFGVIIDQIPMGLCLGTAIGLSVDYKK